MAITFNHNDQVYVKDGKMGIGTATPSSILSVKTTSTTADTFQIDAGSVRTHLLGAESSNGVIYLRNSSNSNYVRINAGGSSYFNGGNVGIGTTSPAYTLDVNGQAKILNGIVTNTGTPLKMIVSGGALNDSTELRTGNGEFKIYSGRYLSSHQAFVFATGDNYTSGAERMRITSAGNVGIGTTSPQSKLHVYGDIRRELDGTSTIGFGSGSTSAWYSGIKTVDFGSQNVGLTLFTTTNAGTTNVDALTIDEDGNVGIGASDPLRKLHVVGDFAVNAGTGEYYGVYIPGLGQGADPQIQIGDWHNASGTITWDSSARALNIDTQYSSGAGTFNITGNDGASTFLTINTLGNVGIGTTSPNARLNVKSTDSTTDQITLTHSGNTVNVVAIGQESSHGSLVLRANSGVNKVRLSAAGNNSYILDSNVGIGTTSPVTKLEVDKNLQSDTINRANSAAYIRGGDIGLAIGQYASNPYGTWIQSIKENDTAYPLTLNGLGGNVGIGTTSPDEKLDVLGNIQVGDGGTGASIKYNSTNRGTIIVNGSEIMRLEAAGNVGIGTTSPLNKLSVITRNNTGYYQTTTPIAVFHGASPAILVANDANASSAASEIRLGNAHSTYYPYSAYIKGLQGSGIDRYRLEFGTSNGAPASTAMTISQEGNVGIGTTSPYGRLNVIPSSNPTTPTAANQISVGESSGNAQYNLRLGYFLEGGAYKGSIQAISGNTPNTLVLNGDGGGVGIGTTSPAQKLEVSFAGSVYGARFTRNDATGSSLIEFANSAGVKSIVGYDAGVDGYRIGTSTANNLTVKQSGNVGIGTTSPTHKAHILDTGYNRYTIRIQGGQANNAAGWSGIGFSGEDSNTKGAILFESLGASYSRGKMIFALNNEENQNSTTPSNHVMTLEPSGNVGIGTTSPGAKLDITTDHTSQIPIRVTHNNYNDWLIQKRRSDDTQKLGIKEVNSNGGMGFATADAVRMVIDSSGNVGIGTTVPNAISGSVSTLSLGGTHTTVSGGISYQVNGSVKFYQYVDSDGLFIHQGQSGVGQKFKVNGSEAMRITAAGNVGIGTTSPGAKLEVNYATYSANNAVANFVNGNNPVRVAYDTVVVAQQDVPCLSIVETPDGTQANEQKLTFSVGDNSAVIGSSSTVANGIYINTARSTSAAGYITTNGTNVARFLNNGNAIFPGNVGIGTTSPSDRLHLYNNGDVGIRLQNQSDTSGNTWRLWQDNWNGVSNFTFNVDYGSTNVLTATTSGNVGIGSTAPAAKLNVASTGANAYSSTITKGTNMKGIINALSSNADDMVGIYFGTGVTSEGTHWSGITGSRSQNATDWSTQLNFYTHNEDVANLNDATQKMVIKGSGNVGIGTTSPASKLHVAQSTGTVNELYITQQKTYGTGTGTSERAAIVLGISENGIPFSDRKFAVIETGTESEASSANGFLAISTRVGGGVNERMRIDSSGNVGIGTTSPDSKLHIEGATDGTGTGADAILHVKQTGGWNGNEPWALYVEGYSYLNGFRINAADGIRALHKVAAGGQLGFSVTDTAPITFTQSNSTERMRVHTNGYIGIGTTSPASKLDVNGDIALKGTSVFNLNSAALTIGDIAGTDSVTTLKLTTAGDSTTVYLDDDGNVGINTATPSYNLTVNSGTNDIGILTASSDSGSYVGFLDDSTSTIPKIGAVGNKLILDADQYVGIKRTDPSYALDVSGTIRATGDVIAYSDARVKENVETIPNALDKVKAMRGVGYNKIGEEKRSIGVIAQELLEVVPEAVHKDDSGMYSVAYGNLVGVLIEAVKDLEAKVEQLENKLNGTAS